MSFVSSKVLHFLFQFLMFGFMMKRVLIRGFVLDFVVVAAMEAIVGLHLQLGQVSCDQ